MNAFDADRSYRYKFACDLYSEAKEYQRDFGEVVDHSRNVLEIGEDCK